MSHEEISPLLKEGPCRTCSRRHPVRGCPVGVGSCDTYLTWFVPVWDATCAMIAGIAGASLEQLRADAGDTRTEETE